MLFVPGYQENFTSRDYALIMDAIRHEGLEARFISVNWNRTTIDDWLEQLMSIYDKENSSEVILAGFSFGAMTALMAAAQRTPAALWLCSLSPYFHEDILSMSFNTSWIKIIGKRRTNAFDRLKFIDISKKIKCDTTIFIGEKEIAKYDIMEYRSIQAHQLIKGSTHIVVPNAAHDVADKNYVEYLRQVANER